MSVSAVNSAWAESSLPRMLLCLSNRVLGEVLLVAFGEVAVVVEAAFELGEPGGVGVEGSGCGLECGASLEAPPAQVRALGDSGRVG